MVNNVHWSPCEVPLIHVTFYLNLYFLNRFSKNTTTPSFVKILPVGAEFLHAEGRTDRHDEANIRFSQVCESNKKRQFSLIFMVNCDVYQIPICNIKRHSNASTYCISDCNNCHCLAVSEIVTKMAEEPAPSVQFPPEVQCYTHVTRIRQSWTCGEGGISRYAVSRKCQSTYLPFKVTKPHTNDICKKSMVPSNCVVRMCIVALLFPCTFTPRLPVVCTQHLARKLQDVWAQTNCS